MNRTVTRTVVVSALLLVGAISASSATPACTTRQCDASFATWGFNAREGHMIDDDTWESNGPEETWLDYGGQRTWLFCADGFHGRTPSTVTIYVSTDANPNGGVSEGRQPNANSALASGNLGEFALVPGPPAKPEDAPCAGTLLVRVTNDTCGDYVTRVVIRAEPKSDDAGPDSTPTTDASSDAPADVTPNGG